MSKDKQTRYRVVVTHGTKPKLSYAENLKSAVDASKVCELAIQLGYSDATVERYEAKEIVTKPSQKNGATSNG